MEKTLKIEGMMCAHCVAHVQKALAALDGVSDVNVQLEGGVAAVTLTKDVPDEQLMNAVKEAGYTPLECKAE